MSPTKKTESIFFALEAVGIALLGLQAIMVQYNLVPLLAALLFPIALVLMGGGIFYLVVGPKE